MRVFKKLEDVVNYIVDGEDASKFRWNNSAGDWDIEDIRYNAAMYDEQYSEYTVDIDTYDIYDENYERGECLFQRIEDSEV